MCRNCGRRGLFVESFGKNGNNLGPCGSDILVRQNLGDVILYSRHAKRRSSSASATRSALFTIARWEECRVAYVAINPLHPVTPDVILSADSVLPQQNGIKRGIYAFCCDSCSSLLCDLRVFLCDLCGKRVCSPINQLVN